MIHLRRVEFGYNMHMSYTFHVQSNVRYIGYWPKNIINSFLKTQMSKILCYNVLLLNIDLKARGFIPRGNDNYPSHPFLPCLFFFGLSNQKLTLSVSVASMEKRSGGGLPCKEMTTSRHIFSFLVSSFLGCRLSTKSQHYGRQWRA